MTRDLDAEVRAAIAAAHQRLAEAARSVGLAIECLANVAPRDVRALAVKCAAVSLERATRTAIGVAHRQLGRELSASGAHVASCACGATYNAAAWLALQGSRLSTEPKTATQPIRMIDTRRCQRCGEALARDVATAEVRA